MQFRVENKQQTQPGFTLVELLIVIVVIAILAAISIVAYNGIQQRAENNKSIAAATAYMKAMKMYEVDHGEVPHAGYDSCLGESYPWDFSGADSGTNQCRSTTSRYYVSKAAIATALSPYLGSSMPTPSMQVIGNETTWIRGIVYSAPSVGGSLSLLVALKGIDSCPDIGGQGASSALDRGNGLACAYIVGQRLR